MNLAGPATPFRLPPPPPPPSLAGAPMPLPPGAPSAYVASPIAPSHRDDPGGWLRFGEGLQDLLMSPVLALGGAAAGAVVARVAGRAMLSGGAIGAVAGGAFLTLAYFGRDLVHWAGHRLRREEPDQTFGGLVKYYGPGTLAVTAIPALGFAVGGPVGAIVGAVVALPLGFLGLLGLSGILGK